MLNRSFSNTSVRKIDDNTYRFIASDETIDRYRAVIKASGWNLKDFENNPIALYNHNSGSQDPSNVIGKWRVWVEDGALMGDLSFAPDDVNPKAKMVKGLLEFGAINSVSVGFDPKVWSRGVTEAGEDKEILYFRDQHLLEISVVDIPANPNALASRSLEEFVKLATEDETPQPEAPKEIEVVLLDRLKTDYLKLKIRTL